MSERSIVERLLVSADEKFVPPESAQNAAKKALRWKEEHGDEVKAMTRTGWTRARQLANGDALSYDVVKRMAQFKRHQKNSRVAPKYRKEPWKDNGYVAWCVTGDTLIALADGSEMEICDIVDGKMDVDVLSYNEDTGRVEPRRVLDWMVGESSVGDFLCVGKGKQNRLHISSKTFIKVTPEHEVFSEGEWVPASDMGGERGAYLHRWFDDIGEQVLIGTLLGDASIEAGRLSFSHGSSQRGYAEEKARILGCKYVGSYVGNYGDSRCQVFRSKVMNGLKEMRNEWYAPSKTVGGDILEKVGDIALAFWFMDDGSLHRGKTVRPTYYYRLHTEGFDDESLCRIIAWFNRQGLEVKAVSRRNTCGAYLRFTPSSSAEISRRISPYVHESMAYKVIHPCEYGLRRYKPEIRYCICHEIVSKHVKCEDMSHSFKKAGRFHRRYNIAVEGNNNYFANGLLVHNCGWGGSSGIEWAIGVVNRVEKKKQSSIVDRLVSDFVAADTLATPLEEETVNDVFDRAVAIASRHVRGLRGKIKVKAVRRGTSVPAASCVPSKGIILANLDKLLVGGRVPRVVGGVYPFLHEIGHFVFSRLLPLQVRAWYESEFDAAGEFASSYGRKSPHEDFSESFAYYLAGKPIPSQAEERLTFALSGRIAARGQQVVRKDKDLMQDTGGTSKGRDREPHIKPPRDDVKERYRDRRLVPEKIDKDTNEDNDRPVKKPNRRPQARRMRWAAIHKMRVFDFDDTLVSSESSVRVKHEDGEVTDLDSAAFAYFVPSGGDKIDFTDFNNVTKPRVIKKNMDAFKEAVADKDARAVVLTARPKGSASAVKKFLSSLGIDNVDVVALQSSDPMDKTRWIEGNMEGIDDIEFTDDSSKNVEAVDTLKGKVKRLETHNPPHPTDADYEGEPVEETFESDASTTVEIEKKGPSAPSRWWDTQTPEFQKQYCLKHPESKYCGG